MGTTGCTAAGHHQRTNLCSSTRSDTATRTPGFRRDRDEQQGLSSCFFSIRGTFSTCRKQHHPSEPITLPRFLVILAVRPFMDVSLAGEHAPQGRALVFERRLSLHERKTKNGYSVFTSARLLLRTGSACLAAVGQGASAANGLARDVALTQPRLRPRQVLMCSTASARAMAGLGEHSSVCCGRTGQT